MEQHFKVFNSIKNDGSLDVQAERFRQETFSFGVLKVLEKEAQTGEQMLIGCLRGLRGLRGLSVGGAVRARALCARRKATLMQFGKVGKPQVIQTQVAHPQLRVGPASVGASGDEGDVQFF